MNKWCIGSNSMLLFVFILTTACTQRREKTSRVEELPYYMDASFTPQWIESREIAEDFHRVGSFELFNQRGESVTEKRLDSKVSVVNFFFTSCPGICPKMMSNMMLVQKEFMDVEQVQILSHSVTPGYDSTAVLKEYAEVRDIKKKDWHLLTGERSVIYGLGRNYYFIEEDLGLEKDPEDFIHTENFVLIDQQRRIRGIYNGLNKSSVNQLIADVKTLLRSGASQFLN